MRHLAILISVLLAFACSDRITKNDLLLSACESEVADSLSRIVDMNYRLSDKKDLRLNRVDYIQSDEAYRYSRAYLYMKAWAIEDGDTSDAYEAEYKQRYATMPCVGLARVEFTYRSDFGNKVRDTLFMAVRETESKVLFAESTLPVGWAELAWKVKPERVK